jgi:hypothetical protein
MGDEGEVGVDGLQILRQFDVHAHLGLGLFVAHSIAPFVKILETRFLLLKSDIPLSALHRQPTLRLYGEKNLVSGLFI